MKGELTSLSVFPDNVYAPFASMLPFRVLMLLHNIVFFVLWIILDERQLVFFVIAAPVVWTLAEFGVLIYCCVRKQVYQHGEKCEGEVTEKVIAVVGQYLAVRVDYHWNALRLSSWSAVTEETYHQLHLGDRIPIRIWSFWPRIWVITR
jgi:hypothetical protein